MAFDLERGSILAIGGQYDLHVIKEMENLAKVPSIFAICRSAADNEEEMKIDIADHKIAITLSPESVECERFPCVKELKGTSRGRLMHRDFGILEEKSFAICIFYFATVPNKIFGK